MNDEEDDVVCEFDTPDGPCPNNPLMRVEVTISDDRDGTVLDVEERDACTHHAREVLAGIFPGAF